MKTQHTNHIDIWQHVFEAYTQRACKNRAGITEHVTPYLPSLYRRFLYTSLSPGSFITPAALMRPSGDEALALLHAPLLTDSQAGGTLHMQYNAVYHAAEDHPVFSDLKMLRALFSTPRDLDTMETWVTAEVLSCFSLRDFSYLEFLTRTAIELRLLVPFPSLYAFMMQSAPTEQSAGFDNLPPDEKLKRIAEAVIEECAAQVSEALPVSIVLPSDLEAVLHNPLHFDAFRDFMFADLDESVHFLAEEIKSNDELFVQLRHMYQSGLFVFSMLMDKFFYTPLGFFLRLIQPVYPAHGSVTADFRRLYTVLKQGENPDAVLYLPVITHCFTALGAALFDADAARYHPADLPADADTSLIIADAKAWLTGGGKLLRTGTAAKVPTDETVYTITAVWPQNPDFYATLEISERAPLSELHKHLAYAFMLDQKEAYSFFSGTQPNPFIEYRRDDRLTEKPTGRKSARATFASFCPADGAFLYTTFFDLEGPRLPEAEGDSISLALSVQGTRKAVYGSAYPMVKSVSRPLWDFQAQAASQQP